MKWALISLVLLMGIMLSSCAGRTPVWNRAGEERLPETTLLDEAALLRSEGDTFFKEGAREERVRDALVRWQQAVDIDPRDHDVYQRISRAYAFLATEHLPEDADEQARAAEEGIVAAERALMLISPEFGERMARGANIVEGMEVLGAEAAQALYWYAVNLDVWLQHQSRWVRMRKKGHSELAVNRVLELDEQCLHGAAHRFFGKKLAARDEFDEAREHLEKALEMAPEHLTNRLLLAKMIAVPLQDREMFEEHLGFILEAEDEVLVEQLPEVEGVRERARVLFARTEELF